MLVIKKEGEIFALMAALNFIKFVSEDYDARYISGSPLINSIINNCHKEVERILKRRNMQSKLKQSMNIEDYKHILKIIKIRLRDVDNWHDLNKKTKTDHIKELVYPYLIQKTTIANLLKERNSEK